eukprot:jgi/Chlat1/9098/Chrsp97S08374
MAATAAAAWSALLLPTSAQTATARPQHAAPQLEGSRSSFNSSSIRVKIDRGRSRRRRADAGRAQCCATVDTAASSASTVTAPPAAPSPAQDFSAASPNDPACSGQDELGLRENRTAYRARYAVRCYEVGVTRHATLDSIANLLQETAVDHARSLGFTSDGFATSKLMSDRNLIWVLGRLHVQMDRYPSWGDVVEIDTFFDEAGRLGVRRDWVVRDAITREQLGAATSTWLMMNEKTRRLSRMPEEMRVEYINCSPRPQRFALGENNSGYTSKIPELPSPPQYSRTGLQARRVDLDMNAHVNNVTYVGWLLEAVPAHVFSSYEVHQLTIEYKAECGEGELVDSESRREDNFELASPPPDAEAKLDPHAEGEELSFVHQVRLHVSKKELNRARTVWRPRSGNGNGNS